MTKDELMALIQRSNTADLGYLQECASVIRRVFCTWHKGLGRHLISTNTSSGHVQALLKDSTACLYFADNETFEGLCLSGSVVLHFEHPWKQMLWHPQDVQYYPLGVDDPDYCVMEFIADSGSYYRFDGKGHLSTEELMAYDLGKVYSSTY